MANGKKSFLDLFRVEDEIDDDYDEEDEDIFDEEDDDEDDYEDTYKPTRKPKKSFPSLRNNNTSNSSSTAGNFNTSSSNSASRPGYSSAASQRRYSAPTSTATDKLVSFSAPPERKQSNYRPSSEVYVIKPAEFDDAQTVTDFLKKGRAIVINMEGLSLEPAQRIIDFIGGACYGLGGELKAISANIFIAVPNNIEVSGDLREEILNSSNLSPNLGN